MLALLPPLMLAGCGDGVTEASATQPMGDKAGLIVVELFQSQGCSSCPPANAAFNQIAGRDDLVALSFAVTYWDQLGWKDRFAQPAFTQRQRDYAKKLPVGAGVYTPQVVINGVRGIVGNGDGELAAALAQSPPISGGPPVTLSEGSVAIGSGTGRGTVWLVRYDPREQSVAINAGENEGRTLPHRNIVRELLPLGQWAGPAVKLNLPPGRTTNLHTAILVQAERNGAIIAAAKRPAA